LRFSASNSVAAKAEERPLIEHNAGQIANTPERPFVIPSMAEQGEGPPARELVTQITLAVPRMDGPVFRVYTEDGR
jgi:hypothetical protein